VERQHEPAHSAFGGNIIPHQERAEYGRIFFLLHALEKSMLSADDPASAHANSTATASFPSRANPTTSASPVR